MLDSNQSTIVVFRWLITQYTFPIGLNAMKLTKTRNKSSRIPNKDSFSMTYNSFTLTLYVISCNGSEHYTNNSIKMLSVEIEIHLLRVAAAV